jgi:hypothetical protein
MIVTERVEGAHWLGHPMSVAHIVFEGRSGLVYAPPGEFDTLGDVMQMSAEAQRQHPGWAVFVAADAQDFAKALESSEGDFLQHVMEYMPSISADLKTTRHRRAAPH